MVHGGLRVTPIFFAKFQQVQALHERLRVDFSAVAHIEFFVANFHNLEWLLQFLGRLVQQVIELVVIDFKVGAANDSLLLLLNEFGQRIKQIQQPVDKNALIRTGSFDFRPFSESADDVFGVNLRVGRSPVQMRVGVIVGIEFVVAFGSTQVELFY